MCTFVHTSPSWPPRVQEKIERKMERGWSEGNSVWLTIGHWQEILASCFLLGCLKSVETRAGKAVEGRHGYPMLCNQCVNERGSRKTCAMLTGKDFLISFSARTMWHSEWLRLMFSLKKRRKLPLTSWALWLHCEVHAHVSLITLSSTLGGCCLPTGSDELEIVEVSTKSEKCQKLWS